MKRIRFQVGGPKFHPAEEQAREIAQRLGSDFECRIVDGPAAFDGLDDVDLLVPMALYWAGMTADWAGALTYEPPLERHKQALRGYVGSGRPLLCFHSCIASFDDWPEYGELLGYKWLWDVSAHTPVAIQRFRPLMSHPIVEDVGSFLVEDETYFNIQFAPGVAVKVIAEVEYEKAKMPILFEIDGGRIAGAGKSVYVANGHDMRAFAPGQVQRLVINAIHYLLNINAPASIAQAISPPRAARRA